MQRDHIFREYDIRGIFQKDLDFDIVTKIGYGIGALLKANGEQEISIGYDARNHSKILFEWLAQGLSIQGITIYNLGLVPTPVAYFATFTSPSKSSIMITGSHNPKEYNGFKITLSAQPFYGQAIQKLKTSIASFSSIDPSLDSPHAHPVKTLDSYIDFLTEHFQSLKNFPHKVAIDCGNGVAGIGIIPVLKNLGIDFTALYEVPDGDFPNHHPDPSEKKNLKDLRDLMVQKNIHIGLAFDGDADRIALLSTNHSYAGDELAILFAQQIAQEIAPQKPIIIGEVKCSQNMYQECDKLGKSIMYKTGHSNLKVKLKELNASLAAEMSGHIFFNDRYFGYDDAIYAGLRALELFLTSSILEVESKILSLPQLCSTPEEKIPTEENQKFQRIDNLIEKLKHPPKDFPKILNLITIDGVRIVFEEGWALVRASNTTPTLITRFEAKNQDKLQQYQKHVLSLL